MASKIPCSTTSTSTTISPNIHHLKPYTIYLDRHGSTTVLFRTTFTPSLPISPSPTFVIQVPQQHFSNALDNLFLHDSRTPTVPSPSLTFPSPPTLRGTQCPDLPAWRAILIRSIGRYINLSFQITLPTPTPCSQYAGCLIAVQANDATVPTSSQAPCAVVLQNISGNVHVITIDPATASNIVVTVQPQDNRGPITTEAHLVEFEEPLSMALPHATQQPVIPIHIKPSPSLSDKPSDTATLSISFRYDSQHYPAFDIRHRINVPHSLKTNVYHENVFLGQTAFVPNPTHYDLDDVNLYLLSSGYRHNFATKEAIANPAFFPRRSDASSDSSSDNSSASSPSDDEDNKRSCIRSPNTSMKDAQSKMGNISCPHVSPDNIDAATLGDDNLSVFSDSSHVANYYRPSSSLLGPFPYTVRRNATAAIEMTRPEMYVEREHDERGEHRDDQQLQHPYPKRQHKVSVAIVNKVDTDTRNSDGVAACIVRIRNDDPLVAIEPGDGCVVFSVDDRDIADDTYRYKNAGVLESDDGPIVYYFAMQYTPAGGHSNSEFSNHSSVGWRRRDCSMPASISSLSLAGSSLQVVTRWESIITVQLRNKETVPAFVMVGIEVGRSSKGPGTTVAKVYDSLQDASRDVNGTVYEDVLGDVRVRKCEYEVIVAGSGVKVLVVREELERILEFDVEKGIGSAVARRVMGMEGMDVRVLSALRYMLVLDRTERSSRGRYMVYSNYLGCLQRAMDDIGTVCEVNVQSRENWGREDGDEISVLNTPRTASDSAEGVLTSSAVSGVAQMETRLKGLEAEVEELMGHMDEALNRIQNVAKEKVRHRTEIASIVNGTNEE